MKKTLFAVIFLFTTSLLFSQGSIPSVDIKDINGKTFNTSEISNDGKPIIIDFWSTSCKPCIKELIAIDENYEDWQEETGVKVYAVSIDKTKSVNRVAPFINGKGWEFEILLDVNWDFKRAMNVINIPHTLLIDGNGKIVWQHSGFNPGDEEELYEQLKKLAAGESVKEKH